MLLTGIAIEIGGWPGLAAIFYLAALLLLVLVFTRADLFRVNRRVAWGILLLSAVGLSVLWIVIRPTPPPSAGEVAREIAKALPPSPAVPTNTAQPTFVDDIKTVDLIMGNNSFGYSVEYLGSKGIPLNHIAPSTDEWLPVYVSFRDGKIYVDMTLHNLDCQPAVTLKDNRITLNRENWDRNMTNTALEVVDENYDPMFQLVYVRPDKLKINGVFCASERKAYITDERFAMYSRSQSVPFRLKRIFKYPSWKYPGELEEK